MKHVRLPIYDGDEELNEHLEVSVEILEKLAKTSIIYKDHVKIVPGLTVEQEMDFINRIMCGLPTQSERMASVHYLVDGDKVEQLVQPEEVEWRNGPRNHTMEEPRSKGYIKPSHEERVFIDSIDFNEVALVDVYSKHPPTRTDEWRPIPDFSRYEMSAYRAIAEGATGLSVSINKGRLDNILLTNDDGIMKRMSVNYLFEQTFPEH
jgi:hypothetical protein